MNKKISIFDSTLRDGAQSEGISFSLQDKLAVTSYLDNLGIDYIECGNPGSNPKDREFFREIKKLKLANAKPVAFTSTHKLGVPPEEDAALASVLEADTEYVTVFGKTSVFHVKNILCTGKEKNLNLIESTIKYLVSKNKKVFFDAEHFFDGYRDNSAYAMAAVKTAVNAGACAVVLCDTNGGTFPDEIGHITKEVTAAFPDVQIGIHAHNDMGMAEACSYFAVENGARQVQGTFGGFGERCGNSNLCTVIGNLQLKLGYECIPPENIKNLTKVSRSICEILNVSQDAHLPYVGASAFTHKGGMHTDAVLKDARSYEHVNPELTGNKRTLLINEMGGRSALLPAIRSVEPSLGKDSSQTKKILKKLKKLEQSGYDFEAAEGSVHLLVAKELDRYKPHFDLVEFNVMISEPVIDKSATAMITIGVDGTNETTAAKGNGPVNALDTALRKALGAFYPVISNVYLKDYKVRVLGSQDGTASRVRVLITSSDGDCVWRTVGVSQDIIEASWLALVDSVEYYLSSIDM